MSVYALVRIKNGSLCGQDFHFYRWPPSQYKEGKKLAGVEDDCVFIAEKCKHGKQCYWECRAPGAGSSGAYGNGSISADEVDILTPMSLIKPTEEMRLSFVGQEGEA